MKTILDYFSDMFSALLLKKRDCGFSSHPVHFCVIDGKRHCVYAPDLPKKDSVFFQRLVEYTSVQQCRLKADQRRHSASVNDCRRKKYLAIVILTLGMQCGAEVSADEAVSASLSLIGNVSGVSKLFERQKSRAEAYQERNLDYDSGIARDLENILLQHYVEQPEDPVDLVKDFLKMARYYSSYKEAVSLLKAIKGKNWQLKYAPHTFQTVVHGTRLKVESAVVYFDPRSAAKLKFHNACAVKAPFCIASPADALLHEFLHIEAIFDDRHSFLAQGGMSEQLYPSDHEHQVILKENVLYRAMSAKDKKPRPIRSEHTGRHVFVSCATCTENRDAHQ
jgi:hypothetical protein